jgi:hypothetical protein
MLYARPSARRGALLLPCSSQRCRLSHGLVCRKARYDDDGERERKRRGRFMLGSSPWKAHWHVCFYCQHRRIHIARLPLRLAASAADPPPAPPNARCGFALALTPSRASIANLFSLRHSLPPLNMCNNAGGAAALGDGAFGANLITFLSSSKAFSELRKVFCRDESEARLPFLPSVLRKRGKG